MIKKVRTHPTQNEQLLFEISSPGKNGYQLPDLDVPTIDAVEALGAGNTRTEIEDFPEVSEVESAANASPPGISPSIWACIRWVPAP
jgi:glycine dehydrogenase subunit 2